MEIIVALKDPTINEFATFAKLSPPNAAYKVNRLIKKGYVNKIQSTTDKREYHLVATEKYSKNYGVIYDYIGVVMGRIQDKFSPDEVNKLDAILQTTADELMPEVKIEEEKTKKWQDSILYSKGDGARTHRLLFTILWKENSTLAGFVSESDCLVYLYYQRRHEWQQPYPAKKMRVEHCHVESLGQERYQQQQMQQYGSQGKRTDGEDVGEKSQLEYALSAAAVEAVPQSGQTQGGECHRRSSHAAETNTFIHADRYGSTGTQPYIECCDSSSGDQYAGDADFTHGRLVEHGFVVRPRFVVDKLRIGRFHADGKSRQTVSYQIYE